jgi:invasion protein IalB
LQREHTRDTVNLLRVVALAAFCLLVPLSSTGKASAEVRRFGDWELVCEPATIGIGTQTGNPAVQETACKAVQRFTAGATNETVFILTALQGEKGTSVAIVSIPLGGYLVPGIELSIDNGKTYKLLIETCTIAGCHAGFLLSGRIDRDLRTGRVAKFRVWTAKSAPIDVSVSLNGFSDALAHLRGRS